MEKTQIHFDAILAGTKKEEYREIKDTTFKKSTLRHGKRAERKDIFLMKIRLVSPDQELDIMMYNNGVYPFFPIEYKFLNLAVGYGKDRDTAVVEVTDISFEIAKDKNGKIVRFFWDEENGFRADENGDSAIWNIVYHLGNVVETNLKSDR